MKHFVLLLIGVLAVACVVFLAGINWGLPSRQIDPYLFGERPAWSGEKIQQLAGKRDACTRQGADVDVNPLRREDIVLLNDNDAQRAEVLRRYRLFTYHPDEMVTMMALASMSPGTGDLDPKLYQYGGLWIYPVGGLLKFASMAGAVRLVGDTSLYLENPAAFGRFYVVARLYSVLWGLVGVTVVFLLVWRLAGGSAWIGAAGGLCFAFMPVVINAVHEAKPHLGGVVLALSAVLLADHYLRTKRRKWGIVTAVLCGLAPGMVLSAWPIIFVLPVVAWYGGGNMSRKALRTLSFVGLAIITYFVVNPYVFINLFTNQEVLSSNLANTRRMFSVGPFILSMKNAVLLIMEGASFLVVVVAVAGIISGLLRVFSVLIFRKRESGDVDDSVNECDGNDRAGRLLLENYRLLILLAIPAIIVLGQFILFAADQEGTYSRFALLVDVVLAIVAVLTLHVEVQSHGWRIVTFALLVLFTAGSGFDYVAGYIEDASGITSRLEAAQTLKELEDDFDTLGIWVEPAPYSLPPVNLFHWKLKLLPRDYHIKDDQQPADVLVQYAGYKPGMHLSEHPDYRLVPTRDRTQSYNAELSWANQSFRVYVRNKSRSD
jgi:hypothetical protein